MKRLIVCAFVLASVFGCTKEPDAQFDFDEAEVREMVKEISKEEPDRIVITLSRFDCPMTRIRFPTYYVRGEKKLPNGSLKIMRPKQP